MMDPWEDKVSPCFRKITGELQYSPCSHLHQHTQKYFYDYFLASSNAHSHAKGVSAGQVHLDTRTCMYMRTPSICTLYTHWACWEDKAPVRGNAGLLEVTGLHLVFETYFHGTVQRTNTVPATTFPCTPPGRVRLEKSGRCLFTFFCFCFFGKRTA